MYTAYDSIEDITKLANTQDGIRIDVPLTLSVSTEFINSVVEQMLSAEDTQIIKTGYAEDIPSDNFDEVMRQATLDIANKIVQAANQYYMQVMSEANTSGAITMGPVHNAPIELADVQDQVQELIIAYAIR